MKPADAPWHASVPLGEISEAGLHREIEADAVTRAAIAKLAGLQGLSMLRAAFDLKPSADQIHVTGRVRATVEQTCVVTLEPVENAIDEPVDIMFSENPPAQAAHEAAGEEHENLESDPPEPILGGAIDLGALATEFMILALDPYPRKPGAVFESLIAPDDPADHPFAGLAALKEGNSSKNPRKSKGK
jgi:uncharacterized metal-binding protein YceD (DUF177 family)